MNTCGGPRPASTQISGLRPRRRPGPSDRRCRPRSCSAISRSKIRLVVCRCLRGASRSARRIRSIASLCRIQAGLARGKLLPRLGPRRGQRQGHGPPAHPVLPRPDPCSTAHRPGSPGGSPRRARPSTSTACTPSTTPTVRVWGDTQSTLILPRLHTGGVKTRRHQSPMKTGGPRTDQQAESEATYRASREEYSEICAFVPRQTSHVHNRQAS